MRYEFDDVQAAGVLITNDEDDLIIAVSRKDDQSDLGLPFGKRETGETPLETAVRETFEETGIELDPEKLQLVYIDIGRTTVAACYLTKISRKTILNSSEEGVCQWVDKSAVLSGSFGDYNRRLFAHLDGVLNEG